MALPSQHRLRRSQDFSRIYRCGRKAVSPHLLVRATSHSHHDSAGLPCASVFGVAVSQKVSKRAVVRNRIKRRIHGVLQQLLPNIRPGWQLVVTARPSAATCEYCEFLRELEQLLTELEVLHGHS